jgi:DNA-binding Lrp family transcriptional regulator
MWQMDATDKAIINGLQGGVPICERPYQEMAKQFDISEAELISRLENLLAQKVLTRFGPMFQIERMGGAFTLAAMQVPETDFERVTTAVNVLPEVAHNYRREHAFNMWFVLATETPEGIGKAITSIETATGYPVYNMPKEKEFFVGARFTA